MYRKSSGLNFSSVSIIYVRSRKIGCWFAKIDASRPTGASIFTNAPARWALPFHALEWALQWTAYFLSRWALLEVLEYLGSLSVLVAVIFYFAESGDRRKQKHYQAWQVINTAQGKGGSGGRIEALSELNEDGVPLVGVDVSGAFLHGRPFDQGRSLAFQLRSGRSAQCNPSLRAISASLIFISPICAAPTPPRANFTEASFIDSDLKGANLSGADLYRRRSLRRRSSQRRFARRSLAETESRHVRQHLWDTQRAARVRRLGHDARRQVGPVRGIAEEQSMPKHFDLSRRGLLALGGCALARRAAAAGDGHAVSHHDGQIGDRSRRSPRPASISPRPAS